MKLLLYLILLLSSPFFSSEGTCGNYLSEDGLNKGLCDHVDIDPSDLASLQRGVKLYMNYCFACHSLEYARFNKVSEDLGIPEKLFKENLLFGDQKLGDLMTIGMKSEDAKEWFGISPPDLTLETSLRGPDWVYTYLKSFYLDSSRPLGVNNKVFENVGMPHVLANLQGRQNSVCKLLPIKSSNGGLKQDPLTGDIIYEEICGFLEVESDTGEMGKEEFNQSMRDITNFLAYMADPIKLKREKMGVYVILYLLIFTIFSYLLYREFKKEVH